MKNIFLILKKELKRFFTDKRMLIALFLPGILIFFIYSLCGDFVTSAFDSPVTNYNFKIVETDNYNLIDDSSLLNYNVDNYFKNLDTNCKTSYTFIKKSETESYKERVKNGDYDLLISYDDDFENILGNISLYYNGSSSESSYLYNIFYNFVDTIYKQYSINIENNEYKEPNLSNENISVLKLVGTIIPMLSLTLIVSSCSTFAPEIVAGEKERKTLGLLLISPVKREEIAISKTLSLISVSLISGFFSFLGIILSIGNLFTSLGSGASIEIQIGFNELLFILLIIVSVLLIIGSFSILISTFARTIKEASALLSPLIFLVMIISLIPSIFDLSNIAFSFIPLLNVCHCLYALFSGNFNILYLIISFGINLIVALIFSSFTVLIFKNEKIMFNNR